MTRTEHLLVILSEECAEVAQRCTKALRFGLHEVEPGQDRTNAQRIADEMGDLIGMWEKLKDEGIIVNFEPNQPFLKRLKVEKFLTYSHTMGTLDKGV